MRTTTVLILAVVLLLVMPTVASATMITFSSDLLNEGNNQTGANVFVVPVGVWAVAPWISFSNTGQGGWSPPNTTIAGTPTAVFYENVFLPYGDNNGWFRGWADDTMGVYIYNATHLGGLLLYPPNDIWSPHCVGQPIGCVEGMDWVGVLDNSILTQGVNTFIMPTYQLWGDGFGVAYRGEINSTPEPAMLGLTGLGLVIIGLFRKFRLRQ